MIDASLELQGAIVALLKADATLAALVDGRVFDHVPRDQATGKVTARFPYISMGPESENAEDFDCIRGTEITMQIDCWSRAVGFPEVKRIAKAVRKALDDAEIELAENALVSLSVDGRRVLRDPDGVTAHAALFVTALVEHD